MSAASANNPDLIMYGGGFDPPHQGHIACLEEVSRKFPDAKIHVVPGVIPAGIGGDHKSPLATFHQRFEMCEKAFAHIPNVIIDPIESQLPAPNYTYKTLEALKERHPHARLGLLMGQDQWEGFPGWSHTKRILELAQIITVKRLSTKREFAALSMSLKKVIRELNIPEERIKSVDVRFPPAESSIIRELIGAQENIAKGWLSDEVAQCIKDHKLYRSSP